jgi:hypothetical protein
VNGWNQNKTKGTTTMRNNWILFPVLVQIILTVEAYLALAWMRYRAMKARAVNARRAAVDSEVWPDRIRLVNNNIRNQFEAPVLFYVLAIVLWQMNAAGVWAQALAWLFVLSRIVHAYVHTGKNNVPTRFFAFLFGLIVVAGMVVLVLIEAFGGFGGAAAAVIVPPAGS